jgi:type IV secretion system protein VirB5
MAAAILGAAGGVGMMWRLVVAIALLLAGAEARANYPVFDAANFGKMAESVIALQQQVRQLEATYKAMSGSRGLGNVFYNPKLKQYLPEDWASVYDAGVGSKYAGLSGTLTDIRRAERLSGTTAEQLDKVQARSRRSAEVDKAVGLRAFDGARQRLSQIETLMTQVNLTKDAKGVAEIQARIAVEQAAVQNETTKLQLVSMLQRAEEGLAREQRRELAQRILDPAIPSMPSCCSGR